MRYLQNENDTLIFKTGDTSETVRLSARNDNQPIVWSDGDTAEIHVDKDGAHVKTAPANLVVGSNNVTFSTSELSELPAGQYQLELWTKLASDDSQAIWPSQGMLDFTIDRNADSLEGGAITTITLDTFKDQLNQAIKEAKEQAKPGKSAYQTWIDQGNKGTEQDFLNSLKGEKGETGATGNTGADGKPGMSAYQLAVQSGFKGTESEWLESLKGGPRGEQGPSGKNGQDGKSAYQVWLDAGNKGTETDFLNSLVGPRGEEGPEGKPGHDGQQGPQGIPGKDGSTPTLKIGTITSVDPDQPANADLIDNKNGSYTLNLTLPRGAKGETGGINQVVKPELAIGTVQTIASDQQASASLTKTGDTGYAINLNIPAGKQGPAGQSGKDGSDGQKGADGKDGQPGKSAYELAVEQGFKGNLDSWLSSLKGESGKNGKDGADGQPGPAGKDGAPGAAGKDGKSAYQIWIDQGNAGDQQAFLNSLKGSKGDAGKEGQPGPAGKDGAPGAAGKDGKDGKRGTVIFTTSGYINSNTQVMTVSISSLVSTDTSLKPRIGDYVIGTVNAESQLLEISKVNDSDVEFSSNMINLQGQIGATGQQGKGIWFYTKGQSGNLSQAQVVDLAGYQSYGVQPQYGDVVIGTDGSVSTISEFTAYASGGSTPTAFSTNASTASLGEQSTEPTNTNFDYDKLPSLHVVDQNKLGKYLGLDSSKSYTLDIDDFTLSDGSTTTSKFLKPGIYLLRDIDGNGYNLTISSKSNMASTYANPVQLIVTPYTVFATTMVGSTATWFMRSDWSHDFSDYYGASNSWVKIGEAPKSAQ